MSFYIPCNVYIIMVFNSENIEIYVKSCFNFKKKFDFEIIRVV